jgi:hypothetical protein
MSKKIILLSLSVLCASLIHPSWIFAATGPASVYKVTIVKFELYNGTSWITLFDGASTTIDIASVDAGQAAGNFFTGLNVPDGTYTQVRVTPSATFVVSGRVGTSYTTAAKANGGCVPTTTAANEAPCSVDVPGGIGTPNPDILPATLTITNGVPSHKIRVSFNVNNAIQDGGPFGELYPGTPTVTMSMIALE